MLTARGDHSEDYLRRAEEAARGAEASYLIPLEDVVDDDPAYVLASEKLNLELKKFPEHLQKELANMKQLRRLDDPSPLTGRQTLCYGLRTFYRWNTDYEESAAQDALQALRDAVKQCPHVVHMSKSW